MSKTKRNDLIIISIFLIIAPLLSFTFKTNLLTSIILFYGLPAILLSFRVPQCIKRASAFSFIVTALFFVIDYVAVLDGAWWVSTIFKNRLLEVLPIEDSIWFFIANYLVILFYEYFDDDQSNTMKKSKIAYLIGIVVTIILVFFALFVFYPQLLVLPYAYSWIALIFLVLPSIMMLVMYPKLRFKFIRTNLYVFMLHITFEITALKLGHWNFPGNNFIGWVEAGNVRFPVEELVAFIMLMGITALSCYEFYGDDRK